jgi:hypothetical protein
MTYRAALDTTVPVPEKWQVEEYQGTMVTVESPPTPQTHGPRFTFEKLAMDGAKALDDACSPRGNPSHLRGAMTLHGHVGSYEYQCAPRTFIGPEWTVLIPARSGAGTWRITYLGADGVNGGSLAPEFTAVLSAFRA